MSFRVSMTGLLILTGMAPVAHGQQSRWWNGEVEEALVNAKENRFELEKALFGAAKERRPAIAFLVANMPRQDLVALKAEFLFTNLNLAYEAREKMPWAKTVPEALFLNEVLPYASVTETREPWRQEMM